MLTNREWVELVKIESSVGAIRKVLMAPMIPQEYKDEVYKAFKKSKPTIIEFLKHMDSVFTPINTKKLKTKDYER